MSRIANCFKELKDKESTAFIPYIMAGDPAEKLTLPILHALADNGADIIEIGFPFSDPTADGPIIQQAAIRSLEQQMNLVKVLEICKKFRTTNQKTPLILMGYANPAMQYSYEAFAAALQDSGIDGVIIVDIPPEESEEITPYLRASSIANIRLIAPTTLGNRLQTLLRDASGFVYTISIKGITGTHSADIDELSSRISDIRQHTDLPVVAGFGIKSSQQAASFRGKVDGVVVGSALVERLHQAYQQGQDVASEAASFAKEIKSVL